MSKKDYNKIEVKDNMVIKNEQQESETINLAEKKKQLTKVVDTPPKKVKHSLVSRLVSGILGPEGLPGIGSYVNDEIIKPAIKNIIFDAITSAASMAMFGDKNGHRGNGRSGYSTGSGARRTYEKPTTNYGNRYGTSQHSQAPADRTISRTKRHGVEEYVIEDRFDAAHVLTTLTEQADRYDSVSVADYYDLIGVDTTYTDNTYGWTIDTITRASIVPVRGGYVIKFPPVEVV